MTNTEKTWTYLGGRNQCREYVQNTVRVLRRKQGKGQVLGGWQ